MAALKLSLVSPAVAKIAGFETIAQARSTIPVVEYGDQDRRNGAGAGAVAFDRLGKAYHSSAGIVHALDNITLKIPAGGIYGVIGRSGAGKSSLIRTINRLENPSEGRVLVDGHDIAALDENSLVELRRRIGMIFQHFNLLSARTVRDNVGLPLRVAGVPKKLVAERVDEVLALVGLEGKHSTYPSRLSGGQKQRVGIARALVHRPEILLCDEATSALDPETTLSILQLLKDINRKLGLTIILITHEMSVIREICDEVLVLDNGKIAEQGPVWKVFGAPQHAATRALLQPLDRDVPEDLAALLQQNFTKGAKAVVELRYNGHEGPPDLSVIAAIFDAPIRLLYGTVDRIQGHSHGRLLIATALREGDITALQALHSNARLIGYVTGNV